MIIFDAIAAAGVLSGTMSLVLTYRHRLAMERCTTALRGEIEEKRQQYLCQITHMTERLDTSERNAQSNAELLRDGRLATPVRSRALRMLRSGMAPDTVAGELGLTRAEIRLLAKVGDVL